MIRRVKSFLLVLVALSVTHGVAEDHPPVDEDSRKRLETGEYVVLDRRPDEKDTVDHRFVTVAAIIEGSRNEIWEVINDKENAADFIDGVLESKVIEREGNRILVEQRTHVGGPKGSYRYRLSHTLTPRTRADFTYVGGELRDVLGSWWIFEGTAPSNRLVVYSLHIDPGFLAPQLVVKSGMKKSMPGTIRSIAREVLRRRNSE